MSKNKKAKSQQPHPLVHNRLVTRRQRKQEAEQPATLEPQVSETQPETPVEQPAPEALTVGELPDEILDQPYCEVLDEPVNEVAPTEVTPAEAPTEAQPEQLQEPKAEQPAPATTELEHAAPEALAPEATETSLPEAQSEGAAQLETPPSTKPKKAKKEAGPKKMSCLDAAAQVLKAAGKPMTCNEMIEEMSKQGLWASPNGATPGATLYSAILREMKKGDAARFVKADRGKFTAKA